MFKKKNQRTGISKLQTSGGFILSFSVLVAGVLLSIGLAMYSISLKELILSSGGRESQFAFYAADSGGECALYWDIRHPGYSGSVFAPVESTTESSLPTEGLVGHWQMDEGSGMTVGDSSGNGNDGTMVEMEESDWIAGKFGSGLQFTAEEHVDLGNSSILHPDNAITVSAWAYNEGDAQGHIVNMGGGWDDNGYSLFWHNNNIRIELQNDSEKTILDNDEPADGTWNHLAFTWDTDTNTVKTYINGTQADNTATFNGPIGTPSENLNFGRKENNGRYFIDGRIDEIRIYDRALDNNEIVALYNNESSEIATSYGPPLPPESNIMCNGVDISDPNTGWSNDSEVPTDPLFGGWYTTTSGNATTTVFDMEFENGSCATVTVRKTPTQTRIDSLGYNSCPSASGVSNPRRVERGLRITY